MTTPAQITSAPPASTSPAPDPASTVPPQPSPDPQKNDTSDPIPEKIVPVASPLVKSQSPFETIYFQQPTGEKTVPCYKDYCKLYFANIFFINQLKVLLDEKNELMQKVGKPEVPAMIQQKPPTDLQRQATWTAPLAYFERKKRHRRTAGEIERHYRCPVPNCLKSYGSEGSLSQHIKLKHKGFSIDNSTRKPFTTINTAAPQPVPPATPPPQPVESASSPIIPNISNASPSVKQESYPTP